MKKIIKNIFISCIFTILFSEEYNGYLREIEVSGCQDACSHYFLEDESGGFITNIMISDLYNPIFYIDRFVEIEGDEIWCVECGAVLAEDIQLSYDCEYPISCFADPCEIANECAINTPVECIPNYCDGCYADFYDLEGNLVDCFSSYEVNPCDDIGSVFFGWCDMFLGYAMVNGICEGVSGCSWESDGIDYSNAFFNNLSTCENNCINEPYICEDIEYDYNQLYGGIYIECNDDSDCISVWGDCDIGLGGCHYSVNESVYSQNEIDNLVNSWIDNNCTGGVCDCMPLPDSFCNNGICELGYCIDENPVGCFSSGCPENYGCIDYEYSGDCVASSCFCDEFYGDWACTEDCNGGTCYEYGDVNYDDNLNVIDAVLIIDMILNFSDVSLLSDVNIDGSTNIVDVVLLISIILD